MQAYITTKVVLAELAPPPVRMIKDDIEPHTVGYKVVYPDGYESWCPREVFERTSRPVIATEKSLIFQETVLVEEPIDEDESVEEEDAGTGG